MTPKIIDDAIFNFEGIIGDADLHLQQLEKLAPERGRKKLLREIARDLKSDLLELAPLTGLPPHTLPAELQFLQRPVETWTTNEFDQAHQRLARIAGELQFGRLVVEPQHLGAAGEQRPKKDATHNTDAGMTQANGQSATSWPMGMSADERDRTVSRGGKTLDLGTRQALWNVLCLLVKNHPNPMAVEALQSDTSGTEAVYQKISQLNRKLTRLKIRIIHIRNRGYRLEDRA